MLALIGLIILVLLTCFLSSLRHILYKKPPLAEWKRRAERGDRAARMIYDAARFGPEGEYFLLGVTVIFAAWTIMAASRLLDPFAALLFISLFIYIAFLHIPRRHTRVTRKTVQKLSPYLGRLLKKSDPMFKSIARIVRRYRPVTVHTGLYEKEDLVELIKKQKEAQGNRIEPNELAIVMNALEFGDKTVKDVMTPRSQIRFVSGNEPVGPILITELHSTGFSRFPVTADDPDQVVGTLYLRDLVDYKKAGVVKNVMKSAVYYVHQERQLEHVLSAFIKTKHHIFIAVNEFEEIVGLITIEDVIEQIIGHEIVDEFDQHADLRAVATLEASQEKHLKI